MNHARGSASRCDACHNGAYTGAGHQGRAGHGILCRPRRDQRSDCDYLPHQGGVRGFTSWAGGIYPHQATDTNCSTCHNGTTATGMTTPPHIPTDRAVQQLPHQHGGELHHLHDEPHGGERAAAATPATTASYTSQGTKGALGHGVVCRPRRDQRPDCDVCHTRAATTGFTSWAGGTYHPPGDRHQLLELPQRHDGDRQDDAAAHPDGTAQCSNCHTNTASSFTTYTMNHAAVSDEPLRRLPQRRLHRRRAPRARWAPASYAGHVATNGRDCATCHASAATTASPAGPAAPITHQATDTNCSSCHNGTTATGKTTPPHIPTAPRSAANCHTNTASSFTTYTMNHSAVSASRCDACHNGAYTGEGTKGALGTASIRATSRPTARTACLSHQARPRSFASWAGGTYHPPGDRHQLLELPQRHDGAPARRRRRTFRRHRAVQQLPHQYGVELHHLHDEPYGGERQPLRRLPQRRRTPARARKGAQGTASYAGHVATDGRDCSTCHARAAPPASPAGPAASTPTRRPTPTARAATTARRQPARRRRRTFRRHRAVQQLPHQYGGELHHLHDEPYGGEREPLRRLPQRRRTPARARKGALGHGVVCRPRRDQRPDCATCHASAAATSFTSWAGGIYHPPGDRHQLLELPQRHDRAPA